MGTAIESTPSEHINSEEAERYKAAVHDDNPIKADILRLFVEMGNSVMYKKIAGELQVQKARHSAHFADVGLFKNALVILESHHYRLQAREFILNLFSRSVMRKILFVETEEYTEPDTS